MAGTSRSATDLLPLRRAPSWFLRMIFAKGVDMSNMEMRSIATANYKDDRNAYAIFEGSPGDSHYTKAETQRGTGMSGARENCADQLLVSSAPLVASAPRACAGRTCQERHPDND
jgi:hypothetical protein